MKKGKIVSSLTFKFMERLLVKGLGLIISVILARLLSPTEFGEIAIIMVFINLCLTFVQSGLNTALIQSKETKKEDYSTVFYISLSVAVLLVVILCIVAPWVGKYYDNERLILPLQVYSLSLVFAAFNSVQVAKMIKEMAFKEMFVCTLLACILSGIFGVSLAFYGAGIWALVGYYFSNTVISCVTMIFAAKWLPGLVFSIRRAKELFSYGWKMLVSAFLCSLYADIRTLIVGKMFSSADLGYYNRGQQFPDILSNTLDNSMQSVMFPVIAEAQDNSEKVKDMLKKTVAFGTALIMPVMIGLAAVSESFIEVLLTEKWLPCVEYMQILCLGYAVLSIESSNLVAIKAIGRSDVYMKLEAVRRVVMLLILLVSVFCFRTVYAIALGFAISTWVDVLIISIPTKRLLNYGIVEQIKDTWKIMIASLIMGGVVILVGFLSLPTIVLLGVQIIVGIITYVFLTILLNRELIKEVLSFIKK